jgi:hypothetical protein
MIVLAWGTPRTSRNQKNRARVFAAPSSTGRDRHLALLPNRPHDRRGEVYGAPERERKLALASSFDIIVLVRERQASIMAQRTILIATGPSTMMLSSC